MSTMSMTANWPFAEPSGTLGFPDPFAVATIGGEQTKTTSVIKRTLNPYWNESFDMCGAGERSG